MIPKTLAKRVNPKQRPGVEWLIDYDYACTVCGKVYHKQGDAMTCCAEKKDTVKHPWLEAFFTKK
jgi:hypothetical protein